MKRNKIILAGAFLLLAWLQAGGRGAAAQDPRPGPLTPPPKREVTRIPLSTAPEPPPIPVEEIIRRLSQKEDEFQHARASYTYRKTIRVQEYGEDSAASGEFQITTELVRAADGRRYEKVVQQSPSTLRRMNLGPEDLGILTRAPAFVLTTDQLNKYELSYAGKQQVDEISTYLFRVKPRQLERTRAYFEGLVWVDDRDLLVVKSYGKWVTEVGDVAAPDVPFTLFETYRENIDNKYWFPIYTRSDDTLKTKNSEVRIRLTIRWSDYKPLVNAPAMPGAEAAKPSLPPPQDRPIP